MSAKFPPLAKPNAAKVAAQTTITGTHTLSIPSATPPMMIVAGPVNA